MCSPRHRRRTVPCGLHRELARPAPARQSRDLHRREQSITGSRLSAIVFRTLSPALAGLSFTPTCALTVTLTYALAVSANGKGNAVAKTRRISYLSASHVRALKSATIYSVLGFVSLSGLIPESGIHGDSDTNARRLSEHSLRSRPASLRSWRPFRPSCSNERWTARRQTRINSRASGDDGQFGGRFSIPHRGGNNSTAPPIPTAHGQSRVDRPQSRAPPEFTASAHTGTLQYPEAAPGVGYASTRGTSYPCTSSHAARKDRRARCRS